MLLRSGSGPELVSTGLVDAPPVWNFVLRVLCRESWSSGWALAAWVVSADPCRASCREPNFLWTKAAMAVGSNIQESRF